jgi:hypothetical protein
MTSELLQAAKRSVANHVIHASLIHGWGIYRTVLHMSTVLSNKFAEVIYTSIRLALRRMRACIVRPLLTAVTSMS